MPMRPLTWLKFAPVALLPLLAAYAINSGKLLRDLEGRASQVVAQSGAGWAKLSFDGRDATIQGDSPEPGGDRCRCRRPGGGAGRPAGGERCPGGPPASRFKRGKHPVTDLFNFSGTWFVFTGNWFWIVLALAIGIWFGWSTSASDQS